MNTSKSIQNKFSELKDAIQQNLPIEHLIVEFIREIIIYNRPIECLDQEKNYQLLSTLLAYFYSNKSYTKTSLYNLMDKTFNQTNWNFISTAKTIQLFEHIIFKKQYSFIKIITKIYTVKNPKLILFNKFKRIINDTFSKIYFKKIIRENTNLKIGIGFGALGEHNRILPKNKNRLNGHPNGENFLRVKILQLNSIIEYISDSKNSKIFNPNFKFILLMTDDSLPETTVTYTFKNTNELNNKNITSIINDTDIKKSIDFIISDSIELTEHNLQTLSEITDISNHKITFIKSKNNIKNILFTNNENRSGKMAETILLNDYKNLVNKNKHYLYCSINKNLDVQIDYIKHRLLEHHNHNRLYKSFNNLPDNITQSLPLMRKGGTMHWSMDYLKNRKNADYVLLTDADNSAPLSQMGLLLNSIYEGNNKLAAIGSRSYRKNYNNIFLNRIIGVVHSGNVLQKPNNLLLNYLRVSISDYSYLFRNFIYSANLCLYNIWDTQCGFKIFSKNAVDLILNYNLVERSWAFDPELLMVISVLNNFEISEVPIVWEESTEESTIRPIDKIRMLSGILKIRDYHFANNSSLLNKTKLPLKISKYWLKNNLKKYIIESGDKKISKTILDIINEQNL